MAVKSSLARVIRRALRQAGFDLRRMPMSLLEQPSAVLRPTLGDVAVRRVMDLGTETFFFIQIGAFDGKAGDPLFSFVERFNWSGILVEPQPGQFEALRSNYSSAKQLTLKNVAVSDRRGERRLYTIRDEIASRSQWAPQMASFDKQHLLRHGYAEDQLDVLLVPCVTLADLLDEVPDERLDLLQIDVEGYDYEILRLFDFERCRPHIVRFEHKHLSRSDHDAGVRLLLGHGYHVAVEPAGDTLACLRDAG